MVDHLGHKLVISWLDWDYQLVWQWLVEYSQDGYVHFNALTHPRNSLRTLSTGMTRRSWMSTWERLREADFTEFNSQKPLRTLRRIRDEREWFEQFYFLKYLLL